MRSGEQRRFGQPGPAVGIGGPDGGHVEADCLRQTVRQKQAALVGGRGVLVRKVECRGDQMGKGVRQA